MNAIPTGHAASAFAGLPTISGQGRGVIAVERDGLAIAQVAARRGQAARVMELLQAQFGIEPPDTSRCVRLGAVAIAGIGPQAWLVTGERCGDAFAANLHASLERCASVVDQSDAHAILGLSGPKVCDTLAKLVPVDIHARRFRVGDVAQTVCGHVNVMLWRHEDSRQGDRRFEIWVPRSLAASVYHAICRGAAEFGLVRQAA